MRALESIRRALGALGVAATLMACGGGGGTTEVAFDRDASLFDAVTQDTTADTREADTLVADTRVADVPAPDDATGEETRDAAVEDVDASAEPDAPDVAPDGVSADTNAPEAAPPVLWFVHISDTHIGSSERAAASLSYVFDTVLPAVDPVATIHTGDLVDDGGEGGQWDAYAALVADAPAWPRYVELIGNHDKKNDGTPRWTAAAVAGTAGAGRYGQLFWDTPAGRVRLVRADTSDSEWNPTNVAGYFGGDQRDALLALPAGDPAPVLTLVAGHHPINGLTALTLLGSGDRMDAVLAGTGAAAYLCGHVHEADIAPHGDVLAVQAPSLGKPGGLSGATGFVLLAWDDGAVSAQVVPLEGDDPSVTWPLLMITHPSAGVAATIGPDGVAVRALAFAPGGVDAVDARLAGGAWVPLRADGHGLWGGPVTQAGAGSTALEVRARAGAAERVVQVLVTLTP